MYNIEQKIRISAWISEYDRFSVEVTLCGTNLVCKNIEFCFVLVPIMISTFLHEKISNIERFITKIVLVKYSCT